MFFGHRTIELLFAQMILFRTSVQQKIYKKI